MHVCLAFLLQMQLNGMCAGISKKKTTHTCMALADNFFLKSRRAKKMYIDDEVVQMVGEVGGVSLIFHNFRSKKQKPGIIKKKNYKRKLIRAVWST